MIVPSSVRRQFRDAEPDLKLVAEEVKQAVSAYCERSGYPYVGRLKAIDSLAEKLESGRYESWANIDDLFACAVVIPTLDKEPGVLDFLREAFEEVVTRGRHSTQKPPEAFRFEATRFIGRLRASNPADAGRA